MYTCFVFLDIILHYFTDFNVKFGVILNFKTFVIETPFVIKF